MSRRSRDTWSRSATSWYRKGWAPPTSRDDTATGSYTGWSRRDTRGAGSSGYEDEYATWRGAKEYENENYSDKEVRKEKEKEIEKGKKNKNMEQTKNKGKSIGITNEDLWSLQRVLNRRKGNLSETYKKNAEANIKVQDLNQKTMQALERLACVYAAFEEAWANLENEKSVGDILYAEAQGVMDELARAQRHQARSQDDVKRCRDSLDDIVTDLTNFRALLEVA